MAGDGEFKPVSRTVADGGESRDAKELEARRDDKRKLDDRMKKDMIGAVKQLNKMSDLYPSRKRSKLVLPSPQVSDAELEGLVKMSREAAETVGSTSGPSAALLQEYNLAPEEKQTAVARTPVVRDALMTEAMNIIALNQTASVLMVGRPARSSRPGRREHAHHCLGRQLPGHDAAARGSQHAQRHLGYPVPQRGGHCHARLRTHAGPRSCHAPARRLEAQQRRKHHPAHAQQHAGPVGTLWFR